MSKVVKLKEKDVYAIVNKIITEQSSEGIPPFPAKKEQNIMPQQEDNKPAPPSGTKSYSAVTDAKVGVKSGLIKAKNSMNELIRMTEVNPEIGGILSTIEKVLSKFEEVYGLPKTETIESKR